MKKNSVFFEFVLIMAVLLLTSQFVNAYSSSKHIISERDYYSDLWEQSESIDIELGGQRIFFVSEFNCTVILLNESEFANFLSGSPYTAGKEWINTTNFETVLSFSDLINLYFVDLIQKELINGSVEEIARFYTVVVNEVSVQNRFSLILGIDDTLDKFLEDLFSHLLSFSYFLLGFFLLLEMRREKKEESFGKARVLWNYAIGFICGGIGTFQWDIYHWYRSLSPDFAWNNPLSYQFAPPFEKFSGSGILTVLTFMMLGFSIMFMSHTVEKDVQLKKRPTLTIQLLFVSISLPLSIFIPILLSIQFIWMIVAIALALTNIGIVYLKAIIGSSGRVRGKTIMVLIGLLGPFLSMVIRGAGSLEYQYLADIPAMLFMIMFYYGIKED